MAVQGHCPWRGPGAEPLAFFDGSLKNSQPQSPSYGQRAQQSVQAQPSARLTLFAFVTSEPKKSSEPALIVVAEDEAIIRMLAVDVLIEAGFEVLEAEHAADALRVLMEKHIQVAVLFTDHHMPGTMTGLHLTHHVSTHWPWIGLLLTSGGMHIGIDDLPPSARFLKKPYSTDHMLGHVRELIAAV